MSNKVIDEKFAAIVDSICYWLGYQTKIGRKRFIHEASLRYPIADSITGNGVAINRIILEKLHPLFKSKKIDLVVYSETIINPEAEKDDFNLNEVYELKLAKKGTSENGGIEHQRVFDDVVRLAYYNLWSKKNCYFMMCGTYEDFKAYFVGQKSEIKKVKSQNIVTAKQNVNSSPYRTAIEEWKPDGLYKDWFKFQVGLSIQKEFSCDNTNWGLKVFQDNYKIRDPKNIFENTFVIKSTCLALTPVGDKNKTHAAGIWKIEALK